MKKVKVNLKCHLKTAYEVGGFLICKANKDEGLGYKEYHIYDKEKREFLTNDTIAKGYVYFKNLEEAVKECQEKYCCPLD